MRMEESAWQYYGDPVEKLKQNWAWNPNKKGHVSQEIKPKALTGE